MARLAMNRFVSVSILSLAMAGAVVSACSSDSNPSPGEDAGSGAKPSTGGKSSTGGSAGSTAKDGGSGGSSGGAGGSSGGDKGDSSTGGTTGDSGPGTGGEPGDGGPVPPSPKCAPAATGFNSDKCTDSKCTPFDNSKLEKISQVGTL